MSVHRLFVFLSLAAVTAWFSVPASAGVKWPYQLDPAFSSNGYDTISTVETAEQVAYDGDDAIVATTTPRDDADGGVNITLYRYGPDGQRKKWTASGNEARTFSFFSAMDPHRYTAVRDIMISADTDRVLLLVEIKYLSRPSVGQTLLISMPRSGAASKAVFYTDPSAAHSVGMQMATFGGRLLVLSRREMSVQLSAFKKDVSEAAQWSPDTSWGIGTTARRSYYHRGCGVYDCAISGSHLKISVAGNIYIAGTEKQVSSYGPAGGLFLLKLKSDGSPASHGVDSLAPGWAFRKASDTTDSERVAGLVVRSGGNFPLIYEKDVFVLSTFDRACGEGLIVYRYKPDGTYSNSPTVDNGRSWTHGGGASGTVCNSLRGRDMTLMKDGKLALVGEYVSPELLTSNSAFLQTMDPDGLRHNLDQGIQTIHAGSEDEFPMYGSNYKFDAVAYHSGQQRLLAVGRYSYYQNFPLPAGRRSSALVSRLMEKPLFSDGFEGN